MHFAHPHRHLSLRTWLAMALVVCLLGCSKAPPGVARYAGDHARFAYLDNWSVTEEDSLGSGVHSITLEGPSDSVIVVITAPAGADMALAGFAAEVEGGRKGEIERMFNVGPLKLAEVLPTTSSDFTGRVGGREVPAIRQRFGIKVLGFTTEKLEAQFFHIEAPQQQAIVMTQVGVDDLKKLQRGLDAVLDSFELQGGAGE